MAVRKTGGLGRGLDALIPAKAASEKETVKNLRQQQKLRRRQRLLLQRKK